MVSRLSSALLCQIDNSIVELIKNQLQSNKVKVELKDVITYFQQHNTTRIIQWKEINRAICQQYCLDRFNSRQRFVGTIVPNSLPPYPLELQSKIQQYLSNVFRDIKSGVNEYIYYYGMSMLTKKLTQAVNKEFNLKQTDLFQYTKLQNKIKCQIQQEVQVIKNLITDDSILIEDDRDSQLDDPLESKIEVVFVTPEQSELEQILENIE
ncbi:Hypothetical_protein [Hexamita inflata]|uniref:Hypothetical_protein n=1 Tax=Hexamita inflata TaxID=28002 RepID=A0AA86QHK8_9EUKA|nr:Hypothetical protein HINF_LOCUS44097 [Hexamita inflata]